MRGKTININSSSVICFSDGSVEKPYYNRTARTSGSNNGQGYLQANVSGKTMYIHRMIAMAFLPNYSVDLQVDHIDGDTLNNQPSNLRMVTMSQNLRSFRRPNNSSSKYRGVAWDGREGRWRAYCQVNGKQLRLGNFTDEVDAARAFNDAASKHGYSKEALNQL